MKLQVQLLIAFTLVLFFSMAVFFLYSVPSMQFQVRRLENPRLEESLDRSLKILAQKDNFTENSIEQLSQEILVVNREYKKRVLLQQDYVIMGTQGLLGFLLLQFLVLFWSAFFLIRKVLKHLRILIKGIQLIENGNDEFRFKTSGTFEFQKLAGSLNHLLDIIKQRENYIQEQAKFLGWKEVSSFLTHQFKNPLSSIDLANKNISLQLPEKTPLLNESLTIIQEETQRLSALVKRLRDLTDFPELSLQKTDLISWVREIVNTFSALDIEIEGPKKVEYFLDKQLFEEVIRNLLNNSKEAGANHVFISIRKLDHQNEIIFYDDVQGIDPSILQKIIHSRYTSKQKGSGLGLVFVRRVMSLHHGKIEARLSEASGLVFTLKWPIKEDS